VCQLSLSEGLGLCRIVVAFLGRAPVRRLGCTVAAPDLCTSPHIHVLGGIVRTTSRCCCGATLDVTCVMLDRLCDHPLRNACLSRLCARSSRSTPRGRTSVPDNIGQSQSRQASMSPAKTKLARVYPVLTQTPCRSATQISCAQLAAPAHALGLRVFGDRLCLYAAWRSSKHR